MFSSEEEIIHRVKTIINISVHGAKSDADVLPSLPNAPKQRAERPGNGGGGEDQASKWKKLFHYYDDDHGGALSLREFKKMIRAAMHISESKVPDKDLKLLFERIDRDRSGEIEYAEFVKFVKLRTKESEELPKTLGRALRLALTRLRVRSEADIRNLFDNLDFDADGGITLHQLRRLVREELRLNKHEFSDYYVKRLMTKVDDDSTGQIEFDEFVKFIRDHVNLGGICNTAFATPVIAKTTSTAGLAANEMMSRINVAQGPPGKSATPVATAASEQQRGFSETLPCFRRPAPYTGDQKPRGYFKLPGAERLNRVEGRLFNAGFDTRGQFFKVADASEVAAGGGRPRARPAQLSGLASAPSLMLLTTGKELTNSTSTGRDKWDNRHRTTSYLREAAKEIL